MREHPYRDNWDESRVIMTLDRDDFTAYCSWNAGGRIFIRQKPSRDIHDFDHDAPFRMDILFDDIPEDDESVIMEAGEHFDEQYDGEQ